MTSSAVSPRKLRWAQIGATTDFSGGPNVRDAPSELAPNEAEDAWNVTFDERGGVSSRLGYAKQNGTPFSGGVITNVYWSPLLGNRITQVGEVVYLGDTNTARHTFSSAALITFAELDSLVIACHPIDGLFTSPDGVTWTVVADADAPTTGTCIATWQNKLFVGLPDGSVHWSAAGDPKTWASTDFNKLWEKDQTAVVALHIASGQDILGQAGLLAFKQESLYRITDSTTGEYNTEDATNGAAGPLAVVGIGPKVVTINRHGIWWWADGITGMQNGSDQFHPLWSSLMLNLANQGLWAAGRKGNRAVFSLTRLGSSANDLAIEYHPDQGWCAPRSDAMSSYAMATGSSDTVYGGSPSVTGQVYQLDTGGTDDGAAIAFRFQTRWFNFAGGFLISIWQARFHGRGSFEVTVLPDYATVGAATPFDLTGVVSSYDTALTYDSGTTYDLSVFQQAAHLYSVGVCKQVSLRFEGTADSVSTGVPLLGGTVGTVSGEFGLFGIEFAYWLLTFGS